MKIGIVISVVILLLIGGMMFLGGRGVPDSATRLTAAETLTPQTLPPSLPALYEPVNPDADATVLYEEAVDIAYIDEARLTGGEPPEHLVDDIVDKLTEAMEAGRVEAGMFDAYVDVALFAEPKFGNGILVVRDVAMRWAGERFAEGREQEAVRTVRALFAFGHRLFTHSVRLNNRWQGLQLMQGALMQLEVWRDSTAMSDLPPTAVEQWLTAVNDVHDVWTGRMKNLLRTTSPPVGDLLNMAKNEQDLSLRIEAVLALSIVKHAPESNANADAIAQAIEQAKADANPMIAQAGAFAEQYTRDDLRSQR